MVEGPITLPPQRYPNGSTRHCHGHEFGLASVPPTIRVETSGWIAGLPHCPDGVGGSNVGPVSGVGGTDVGRVGGDATAAYQQKTVVPRPDDEMRKVTSKCYKISIPAHGGYNPASKFTVWLQFISV